MSVDIKCLSTDPPFLHRSYTQWPTFLFSPHPMTPFFPLLYQILHENGKFFARFARILRNLTILWQFQQKICKFCLEIAFLHTEWPPFLGVHTKKAPIFLVPTPNDPLFSTKSYTERSLFSFSGRHLYVTFIFKCPPREANMRPVLTKWATSRQGTKWDMAHWTFQKSIEKSNFSRK